MHSEGESVRQVFRERCSSRAPVRVDMCQVPSARSHEPSQHYAGGITVSGLSVGCYACVDLYLHSSDETLMQSLYPAPTFQFPNE